LIRIAMASPQPQAFKGHSDNGADFCRFLAGSEATLDSCFLARTRTRRTDHTQNFTVFNSPVLVNHTVSLCDAPSMERLAYVLVYNLALAHHCMAMSYAVASDLTQEQRQEAKSVQRKALILYEKSHCLLSRASQNWDASVLHSLAILCNLGHLHHAMGDEEQSEACYQNLLSTIFFIIDSRAGSAAPQCGDVLTEALLDGFFCNVMPLLQKGCVAAAA
jgi:hypothetical protein